VGVGLGNRQDWRVVDVIDVHFNVEIHDWAGLWREARDSGDSSI
jgi:hypothetical protein